MTAVRLPRGPTAAYLKLTVVFLLQGVQDEVEEVSLFPRGHVLKQPVVHRTCSLRVDVTETNVTCEPRVLLSQTSLRISEDLILNIQMEKSKWAHCCCFVVVVVVVVVVVCLFVCLCFC